jgi:ATP-dependent DNA helicase RecQ
VFAWHGSPAPPDSSSTPVVAHLEQAIELRRDADVPHGPVLLCAATMRTGWSLSVSAALLHDAGYGVALPLVIHRLP